MIHNLKSIKNLLDKFRDHNIDVSTSPVEYLRANLYVWGYFGKVDSASLFPLKNVDYDFDDPNNLWNSLNESGPFGFGTEVADDSWFKFPEYDCEIEEWYSYQLECECAEFGDHPVNVVIGAFNK